MTFRVRQTQDSAGPSFVTGTYTYYGDVSPRSLPTGYDGNRYHKVVWDLYPCNVRGPRRSDGRRRRAPYVPSRGVVLVPPGYAPASYDMKPLHAFEVRTFRTWSNVACLNTAGYVPSYLGEWSLSGPMGDFILIRDTDLYNNLVAGSLDPAVSPAMDPKLVDLLKWKAYSKIGNSTAELGIALAQIGQTVSMLAKPLNAVAASYRLLTRMLSTGNAVIMWNGIPRFLRAKSVVPLRQRTTQLMRKAADNWLEYSYGLLPTVRDVQDSAEAIDDMLKPYKRIRFAKAGKKTTTKVVSTIGFGLPSTNFYLKYRKTEETTIKYTCKYYYRYDVPESPGHVLGLDLASAPTVVWDIIPWSFVVDWFIDIGGYLHSVLGGIGTTAMGDYTSMKIDTRISYECIEASYAGYPILTPISRFFVHYESLKRVTNQSPAKFPWFGIPSASIMRGLNAISLITQKLIRGH
jgi:hypothetical protein